MIDIWTEPNPWQMVPTIIIFILCPVIETVRNMGIDRSQKQI